MLFSFALRVVKSTICSIDKTKELQAKIQACDDIHQKAKKKALVRKLKARLDQINNRV